MIGGIYIKQLLYDDSEKVKDIKHKGKIQNRKSPRHIDLLNPPVFTGLPPQLVIVPFLKIKCETCVEQY